MSSPILLPSNVSTNTLVSPSNIEGAIGNRLVYVVPNPNAIVATQKRFALITSLILCNKTNSTVNASAKIVNSSTSAYLLYEIPVPPGTAFEVVNGNKITMKEGDELYVWHSASTNGVLDAIVSYTLHDPLTPYDI
jgi:hypothetical protein